MVNEIRFLCCGVQGVDSLTLEVESWLLVAKVAKGGGEVDHFAESQLRALELQKALLSRLRTELPESVSAAKCRAASICFDLAEFYKRYRSFEQVRSMHSCRR